MHQGPMRIRGTSALRTAESRNRRDRQRMHRECSRMRDFHRLLIADWIDRKDGQGDKPARRHGNRTVPMNAEAAYRRFVMPHSRQSEETARNNLYRLARWARISGDPPVQKIATEHFSRYRVDALAAGISADTAETDISVVLHALRMAQRMGKIRSVPWSGVKLKKRSTPKNVPTMEDIGKCYQNAGVAVWPTHMDPGTFWRCWYVVSLGSSADWPRCVAAMPPANAADRGCAGPTGSTTGCGLAGSTSAGALQPARIRSNAGARIRCTSRQRTRSRSNQSPRRRIPNSHR